MERVVCVRRMTDRVPRGSNCRDDFRIGNNRGDEQPWRPPKKRKPSQDLAQNRKRARRSGPRSAGAMGGGVPARGRPKGNATQSCQTVRAIRAAIGRAAAGEAAPKDEEEARQRLTTIIETEMCRLRHVRATHQAIADADAAEAPGRLAFEIGPEGDRQRRYGLSNERAVMRRFDQFLRVRDKSESGTFDPTDADFQDLFGAGVPGMAVRSVTQPAGDAGNARNLATDVNGPVPDENDGQGPRNNAAPATVDRGLIDSSPHEKMTCGEEQVLRNEPNLTVVPGPLSVVSCKVEAIGELNVTDEPARKRAARPGDSGGYHASTARPRFRARSRFPRRARFARRHENATNEPIADLKMRRANPIVVASSTLLPNPS